MKLLKTTTAVALLFAAAAQAQNCYYPNGDIAGDSSPCGGANKANFVNCCPLNWECMSNGLCYYSPEDFYGRYSCTAESYDGWSNGCADYCTQNGTARGNEAVKQCADGHWCCYNNRSVDCCDDESKEIDLPSGSPTRTITTPPNPTSDDSGGGGGSSSSEASTTSTPDSSSSSSTSTSTSSEPPPSPIPTTFTTQEATTNSQGVATTIIHTSIATYTPPPFPSPTSSSENSSNSNTPLIAGLAAGLPAGLTLAAILLFLLYRRRKNTQNQLPPSHQPSTDTDISHLKPMYTNTTPDGRPPELDSYPVAVGTKPGHMSQISELSGSSPYQQHSSPAVSSMHSPQQSPFVGGGVVGGLGQVKEEKHEPVELPGDSISHTQDWARKRSSYPGQPSYTYPYPTSEAQRPASQQYVAYRPPQEAPPVSPMSPRTDVDHGELERGELKIMNPDVDS